MLRIKSPNGKKLTHIVSILIEDNVKFSFEYNTIYIHEYVNELDCIAKIENFCAYDIDITIDWV